MELNGLAVKLQAECKPETCTQVKCHPVKVSHVQWWKFPSSCNNRNMLPDDSNRAVDISVCGAQNTEGVPCNR